MINIWSVSAFRLMVGLGIGIMLPTLTVSAAEMCPSGTRGRFLICSGFNHVLGQIFICCLAILIIPDL